MPKYTIADVYNIAGENLNRIRSNVDEWADFLTRAAYLYKYPFMEQVIIASMKSDARAVADFDTWSKQLHSRINNGASGVPLIRNKNGRKTVTYFYDITDTNSDYKLWQPNNSIMFIGKLAAAFGNITDTRFADIMDSAAKQIAHNMVNQILAENKHITETGLEEFLYNSIRMMTFERLNLEPSYVSSDFEYINNLSADDLRFIGSKIATAARGILLDVERAATATKQAAVDIPPRQPRRYNEKGERLWNGKTAEQFTEQEAKQFVTSSDTNNPGKTAEQQTLADYAAKQENKNQSNDNIIGNTPYRYVPKKRYRRLNNLTAMNAALEFEKQGIKYSGRINDDMTITLTFDGNELDRCESIISSLSEVDKQELGVKQSAPTTEKPLQLYRIGDFYEAYGADARIIADMLQLHTSIKDNEPMVGIPQHALDGYAEKLKLSGYELFVNDNDNPHISQRVLDNLPDNTITFEERNAYGYTSNYLLPLNEKKAVELFENVGLPIYLLYEDNTEGAVDSVDEIKNFDGLFGIEFDVWERYLDVLEHQEVDNSKSEQVQKIAIEDMSVASRISSYLDEHNIDYDIEFDSDNNNIFVGNKSVISLIQTSLNAMSENVSAEAPDATAIADAKPAQETEKSFAEQVDEVLNGTFSRYDDLKVCDTPQMLIDIGCKYLPIFYTQKHLRDALRPKGYKGEGIHHHGLTVEQIVDLPNQLLSPVMIYDSLSRNDSIVIVTSKFDKDNYPIVAVIKPNGNAKYNLEIVDSNFMLSVYGRENFEKQVEQAIKDNKILYYNKEKSQALFSVLGLQLSKGLNNLDSNIIIHQSHNIVNPETAEKPVDEIGRPLAVGDVVTIDNKDGHWRVSEINNLQISFENVDENAAERSFSHIDFGQHRDNLKETLGYTIVPQNIENRENEQEQDNVSKIHEAFANAIEKYSDLSPTAVKFLERAETQMIVNNYNTFDLQMLKLPLFYSTYGSLSRINQKIFDEKLKDIMADINGYLQSSEPVQNITELSPLEKTIENGQQVDNNLSLTEETAESQPVTEESPIHFGLLGNGITVYDTSREINHDYPTVAHISEEGEIQYYEQDLKPDDIARIERQANLQKEKHLQNYPKETVATVDETELKEIDGIPQAVIVDMLKYGSSFEYGKFRIENIYNTIQDKKERTKAIKKEYRTGGSWGFDTPSGLRGYSTHGNKGIAVEWRSDFGIQKANLSWNKVEKVIGELLDNNEYITNEEREDYAQVEQNYKDDTTEQQGNKELSAAIADGRDIAQNFHITDSALGEGSAKEKYKANVTAIKTLLTVESENRQATPQEQEILSRYVGWGGLPDAFDGNKANWSVEYNELRELLSAEEYNAARSSTLNAHYTAPAVIGAMYKALSNLGFENGKILEPSMGTGNFFGMLPESMSKSKLYGVELDSITGRIAKQLYPNSNIQIKGFEKTAFQSNSFDVAIGNVPFGNYRLNDNDFKDNDLIHDFFFKKSLDKVRPGGVVAFITSKGTLDKQDSSVRKYLAERADLLGAIRLPNNAFLKNAGTEVTSDIIFLQKRDKMLDLSAENMPDWVSLGTNENGIEMNSYFINHPNMVLGEMAEVSGRFGMETTCKPLDDISIEDLLANAVENIKGTIPLTPELARNEAAVDNIPDDMIAENYRNFCYAEIDGGIYYRENGTMIPQNLNKTATERVKGMVGISECLRTLIMYQKEDYTDADIHQQQSKLNNLYDSFTEKYGLLSDSKNKSLFKNDDTSALLLSLENLNDKGELESKADIFTKRTIQPYHPVESVDTASEALAVSVSEKARVDLEYMSQLCSKPVKEIIEDLNGIIFRNPQTMKYETAEEYLSGDVRQKLAFAKECIERGFDVPDINIQALEQVQPEDLKPSEISVQLGSTWVPVKYFEQFMYELLNTPERCRSDYIWRGTNENPFANTGSYNNYTVMLDYDSGTATYGISNKGSMAADKDNILACKTYGTERMNAYRIIEETLNQKPVKVMDYVEDKGGKKRAVLNEKETLLAQDKQNTIKQKFSEWIFDDVERTEELCRIYNDKFNSIRPREYDGSHITFGGIYPEIKLKKHQVDAIAHTLYGGNTLLAHSVGAGKTFEMVASAMESKRLGLCNKSLICVPKPIVGQVAKEFLQLYPTANILVPDEKDFSKENRQRFCSRIATGNYDAIILSHTQLEKIPLSVERQINFIQNEIAEITASLNELKYKNNERGFTVKQLESTRKALENKLEKLNNNDKKDTTVTFEELGVDKLYVDEAHLFKNLYFNSKMGRNIAGINASSISQRATDLFMKCRYLDEKTGSKGVVFATGTPLSNSMTELYTMQNYLQHDKLVERGLNHFDAWASTFGETQLSLELAPEGKGYQMKTRFAKFFNLPELMSMFKEIADIKTADILNLPVPEAEYHTIATEPSNYQKDLVDGLAQRAKAIRNKEVPSDVDNMLNVTNDGRKLALDQRLLNGLLPDNENSKVNVCVDKVVGIWAETADKRSTQMIFCDLSTPNKDRFNVYDDIKQKLISKGISENEIAFIHDYSTDEQRQKLFKKVRSGDVRILLGSTGKMGTGTNCQDKLIAAHHLDCPYRPSDLEQRNGRIIRQGNTNPKVDIYNYVTKGTFDAYLYQIVENKQKFISQIMTSKSPARSAEDVDESVLSYAQIKALASGNPLIKEKMDLDIEVARLRTVFAGYQEERRTMQRNITQLYPEEITALNEKISGYKKDIALAKQTSDREQFSPMTIEGKIYTDKKEAGEALLNVCKTKGFTRIGTYRGFNMHLELNSLTQQFMLSLEKSMRYTVELGKDTFGNLTRIDNALDGIEKRLNAAEIRLENVQNSLKAAQAEVNKPFPQKAELEAKESRLDELNKELSMDNDAPDVVAPDKEAADLTKRNMEPEL